jgi:hypothetical protein
VLILWLAGGAVRSSGEETLNGCDDGGSAGHIVPIPGTRSPRRAEENTHAAGVTLTGADLAAIHDILPGGGFGARYAEQAMPTWT